MAVLQIVLCMGLERSDSAVFAAGPLADSVRKMDHTDATSVVVPAAGTFAAWSPSGLSFVAVQVLIPAASRNICMETVVSAQRVTLGVLPRCTARGIGLFLGIKCSVWGVSSS